MRNILTRKGKQPVKGQMRIGVRLVHCIMQECRDPGGRPTSQKQKTRKRHFQGAVKIYTRVRRMTYSLKYHVCVKSYCTDNRRPGRNGRLRNRKIREIDLARTTGGLTLGFKKDIKFRISLSKLYGEFNRWTACSDRRRNNENAIFRKPYKFKRDLTEWLFPTANLIGGRQAPQPRKTRKTIFRQPQKINTTIKHMISHSITHC